jgi:Na+/melibiose symporter-like transporter
MTESSKPSSEKDAAESKPSFLSIMFSTMAAAFGVQSDKNRERDFKHGRIGPYIAAGILFTILFILVVFSVVKAVLNANGL